jgi:hypothetical protein
VPTHPIVKAFHKLKESLPSLPSGLKGSTLHTLALERSEKSFGCTFAMVPVLLVKQYIRNFYYSTKAGQAQISLILNLEALFFFSSAHEVDE